MSVDGNVWYVKLADGDVERVTLDQLDEAFQNGQIDENSMVLGAGSETWVKLGDLLGASDDPPAPVAASPPAAVQPRLPGQFPTAAQRPGPPIPTVQAAMLRPPPALVVDRMVASLRPVSVDRSNQLLLDAPEFRPSSKKRWAAGALAAIAIAGAGAFLVLRQTSASAASDPVPTFAAAAAALPPPMPVTPPAAPARVSPPTVQPTGPSPVMDPTQRLNDDQRQKLLAADKQPKSKTKSHAGGGGGTSGGYHAPAKDKSSGFTTTGNKFDPLNSSL